MASHDTMLCVSIVVACGMAASGDERRPNIFIAISDDQSWPHASAYGSKMVQTPAFDRVAAEGVLFTNAVCPSPGCSPSRAALLTGRNTWQLEHAGTHGSWFDPKYVTFPERLQEEGYFVGYTGKGWGPGDFRALGRAQNPAGPQFEARRRGESKDYVGALEFFLAARPPDQPFCFWFGSSDAHRGYRKGAGLGDGKRLQDADVPSFLPDTPEIRSDLLDYAFEVERFDRDLGNMLSMLEQAGELEHTLVIVTSDNGMPFPRAKANCYEYGIHVPLALRWGDQLKTGRTVDDLIGFTDLTATIYEVTGTRPPQDFPLTGQSIVNILKSKRSGIVDPARAEVFAARERHSSSRYNSLGYPQRAIRTVQYLYVRNFKPERWPAGAPQRFESVIYGDNGEVVESTTADQHGSFHDIDASPTLSYLIDHQDDPEIRHYLKLAVAQRPLEELFDIARDPGCLTNLAGQEQFAAVQTRLSRRLDDYLTATGDPRVVGDGDVWESYPRVGRLRWFFKPDWAENSDFPRQTWLEARRPKRSTP